MRRRLYWLAPNVESAQRIADDLLLARVDDRHMHFMARPGTNLGKLHEASFLQTSDVRNAAMIGVLIGGFLGAVSGWLLAQYGYEGRFMGVGGVLLMTLVSAGFGFFASTLVGARVPNSSLKQFRSDIESGQILVMVDVPLHKVDDVQKHMSDNHPEATWRGVDPAVPAFP
ncbi:MAG TPA: DUF1269 domain-containing protein [Casimicrobiaceae bacterium]|nr:DUF1269 domain-containing protein [Casimicrobiaceae bacterium]